MNVFIRVAVVAWMVLLVAAPLQARSGFRGRWWHSDQVVSQLQLTESEVQQLDTMYETGHVRMIELRGELKSAELALRVLMEQPDLDETAIMARRQEVKTARSRMADERFTFLLEVRKLIGHDRFRQLMEIRDAQRRQRHSKAVESQKTDQQ